MTAGSVCSHGVFQIGDPAWRVNRGMVLVLCNAEHLEQAGVEEVAVPDDVDDGAVYSDLRRNAAVDAGLEQAQTNLHQEAVHEWHGAVGLPEALF